MGLHPRQMASGPQSRVWEKIADLDRELRQLRESRANQVQRANAYNLAGVTGVTSGTLVDLNCSITLNIPSTNSMVLMWYEARMSVSVAGTSSGLQVDSSAGGPAFPAVLAQCTSTAPVTLVPSLAINAGTTVNLMSYVYFNPYGLAQPTAGDNTFSLKGQRTGGGGTCDFTNLQLWAAVL